MVACLPASANEMHRALWWWPAGGRIKGKSTCQDWCCSSNSFTSASGPVLNPFDMTRSAAGSSSGSGVLVCRFSKLIKSW